MCECPTRLKFIISIVWKSKARYSEARSLLSLFIFLPTFFSSFFFFVNVSWKNQQLEKRHSSITRLGRRVRKKICIVYYPFRFERSTSGLFLSLTRTHCSAFFVCILIGIISRLGFYFRLIRSRRITLSNSYFSLKNKCQRIQRNF